MKFLSLLFLSHAGLSVALRTSKRSDANDVSLPNQNVTRSATNATAFASPSQGMIREKPEEATATTTKDDSLSKGDESETSFAKLGWPWDLVANPTQTSVALSWYGNPGQSYTICWKRSSQWFGPCNYNSVDIYAISGSNWFSGYVHAGLYGLQCGTEYTVKVRRSLFSSKTITFTTDACGCTDPCPYGGWYDGANCQIGRAPSGTTAFIYANNYYNTPLPGNSCTYPGSWYDGANCYVQSVPSGASPFIWLNHWYYEACP